jgi:prophage regulatory protein
MGRLLKLAEVKSEVGLGTSTIYRRMAAGTFPKPKDLGGSVRWDADAIEAWKSDLPDAEYREEAA